MASRVKIKTEEDCLIHFDVHTNNYTLCGLETGGDEGLNISRAKETSRKVNCPQCISIVKFCQAIKLKEYKP